MQLQIKITKQEILKIYKPMPLNSHKGIQGHALIIGGSYGKIGSVCLSSKAAIKSGCGLVTAFIPKCGYDIVQIGIPEVMVLTDIQDNFISNIDYSFAPNAIGVGIGIGNEIETQNAIYQFLFDTKTPMIIDADALNILSLNPTWLSLLHPKTILTPHLKELERLLGKWNSEAEKNLKAIEFSKKFDVIIVMKGAPTFIIDGENIYENITGNQALATAGSGDVLTGILTSLIAQNYEPINAAILGVYLHGLTADIALPETGYHSFIGSDIINYLGKAFLSLKE